jgi:flagellar motor switch protein FliN/FliY
MSDALVAEAGADAAADDWAAAMAEQAAVEAGQSQGGAMDNVQPAPLEDLKPGAVRNEAPANLEAILDIPVTLSVQIGATKISIRNLLQLNQGSVVELDRLAGEPLDVLVNGTLVAHGEVVVVNEKFGIRLTDVVSAQERVRKLQ